MRLLLGLCACFAVGCASRSTLDRTPRDDDAEVDAGVGDVVQVDTELADLGGGETWSREAGGPTCTTREVSCRIGHDFGPSKAVADVFTECATSTGSACGDLSMVFDADGCLVEVRDIRDYSTGFVDCVVRAAQATRWECAASKSLRMYQACP